MTKRWDSEISSFTCHVVTLLLWTCLSTTLMCKLFGALEVDFTVLMSLVCWAVSPRNTQQHWVWMSGWRWEKRGYIRCRVGSWDPAFHPTYLTVLFLLPWQPRWDYGRPEPCLAQDQNSLSAKGLQPPPRSVTRALENTGSERIWNKWNSQSPRHWKAVENMVLSNCK